MFFTLCTLLNSLYFFFFFNDTATTEIYTLSLHDALPISVPSVSSKSMENSSPPNRAAVSMFRPQLCRTALRRLSARLPDRKSTRLNSSHLVISYAVFCLKKKKKKPNRVAHKKSSEQHTYP